MSPTPKKTEKGITLQEDGRVEVRKRLTISPKHGKYLRRLIPDTRGKYDLARRWRANIQAEWDDRLEVMDVRSNGEWFVTLPPDEKYPCPYVKTFGYDFAYAKVWAKEQMESRKAGKWVDPDALPDSEDAAMTLGQLWDLWTDYGCIGLANSTIHRYTQQWEKHLAPFWASQVVTGIKRHHIQDWVTNHSKDYASITVEKAFDVLRRLLSFAVERELIDTNPAVKKYVKFAKRSKPRVKPLTVKQVLGILSHDMRESDRLALKVGYIGVCRQGELLALQVQDFDVRGGKLRISRVVDRLNRGTKVGHKTGEDPKDFRVPERLSREIKKHIMANGLSGSDLLFPSPKGLLWDEDNFRNRVWYPALDAIGVKRVKFMSGLHLLRRSGITHAKNGGFSTLKIAMQSGHEDLGVLEESYFLTDEDEAADVAEYLESNIFGGETVSAA